ncbi:MAG TPA: RNA polymerase sigma factor [Solirubrobacteraceae bacterium]|nr:RNA polymerase sigma factor [Solirubrobacteraceae bacterium]
MTTDAELLVLSRSDAAAFRVLYERYAERIHGYHLRRSGSADAAHDLTAETFAQCWISRGRFRDEAGGSAGPWLFGIARNVLLSSVRQRRLEQRACDQLGVTLERDVSAVEPEERWLDGLDEAFAGLPESLRAAVSLRVFDELPYDELADQLGTTPTAARVRVHRGLRTLRARFTNTKEVA